MMRSPFFRVRGMRAPVSVLRAPVPTASRVPVLGRSLPLSGMKMPLSVLVWASSRRTRILSPRGRTAVLLEDLEGLVAVLDISEISGKEGSDTKKASGEAFGHEVS